MAALTRTSGFRPSLCSQTPPAGHQFTGCKAAVDILAGSPCYLGSDDLVYPSGGVAAEGVTACVLGFTIQDIAAGNVATIFYDERINYGDHVASGTPYYTHVSTAGSMQTTKPFVTARPCAYGLPGGRLQLVQAIY